MWHRIDRLTRNYPKIGIGAAVLLTFVFTSIIFFYLPGHLAQSAVPTKLAVVWTDGDPFVAHRVCLMYAHAAKTNQWFDEVLLVIWGPSAKLFTEDKDIQTKIAQMQKDGVIVQACIVCADAYGIADQLREHEIEVKGMGKPLTDMLQSDWKVLTF